MRRAWRPRAGRGGLPSAGCHLQQLHWQTVPASDTDTAVTFHRARGSFTLTVVTCICSHIHSVLQVLFMLLPVSLLLSFGLGVTASLLFSHS